MMFKFIKIIIVSIFMTLLSGCGDTGWFRDRSNDYVEAKAYPSIKVPTDTRPSKFSEEYKIPEN